jgi:anti-anti-sigma regulatory factor
MNQKFRSDMDRREGAALIKLSGVIDEDNGLMALVDQISAGRATVDLSEITRITSYGVRDWVNWLGKLEKKGVKVTLAGCAPPIVAQCNLVSDFTRGCTVKSFFVPYVCHRCDRESVHLVEVAELGSPPCTAPARRCATCADALEFDDVEERYFAFLSPAVTGHRRG